MNNQQLTMLRRRIDRTRKVVVGIAKAADAALAELNAISDVLDDEVGRNLWSGIAVPVNGKAAKPLTEADVAAIVARALEVKESKQRHPTARTKH